MFFNVTKLNKIKIHFTEWDNDNVTNATPINPIT